MLCVIRKPFAFSPIKIKTNYKWHVVVVKNVLLCVNFASKWLATVDYAQIDFIERSVVYFGRVRCCSRRVAEVRADWHLSSNTTSPFHTNIVFVCLQRCSATIASSYPNWHTFIGCCSLKPERRNLFIIVRSVNTSFISRLACPWRYRIKIVKA